MVDVMKYFWANYNKLWLCCITSLHIKLLFLTPSLIGSINDCSFILTNQLMVLIYCKFSRTFIHPYNTNLTSLHTIIVPNTTCRPSKKLSPTMMTVAPPVVHPSLGLIALMHGVAEGFRNRALNNRNQQEPKNWCKRWVIL